MAGQCYVSGRFGSRAVDRGGTRPRGREGSPLSWVLSKDAGHARYKSIPF